METHPSRDHTVRFVALAALAALLVIALTGCALPGRSNYKSSSIVQFLYPDADRPLVEPQIPTLRLPLRVGIAFAPTSGSTRQRGGFFNQDFPEARKQELLDEVAAQFRELPFVDKIETIPTSYLRSAGGFENLDQIQSVLGVDVIALIAFDQAQASIDDEASLIYWTVIGSYIFPTRKNETHTLMEAVVYDISSRSLLFRAPGVSSIKDRNTLVGSQDELIKDSSKGFIAAADDLTLNLQEELLRFQVRLREEPETAVIEHRPGYTGAGSLSGGFVAILTALAAARHLRLRYHQGAAIE